MNEQSIEYIRENLSDSRYYNDFQIMVSDWEYKKLMVDFITPNGSNPSTKST